MGYCHIPGMGHMPLVRAPWYQGQHGACAAMRIKAVSRVAVLSLSTQWLVKGKPSGEHRRVTIPKHRSLRADRRPWSDPRVVPQARRVARC